MEKKTPVMLKYSIIPYGYRRIFSLPGGGPKRIRGDLSQFNLYAILEFCAKLALLLFVKGKTNFETQIGIFKIVFSRELRLKLLEAINKERRVEPHFLVFHEQPLLYLAKESIRKSQVEGGYPVNPKTIEKVGILLLISTDVCLGWEDESALILPPEFERERVRQSFAKYHFFHSAQYFPYQLARYYLIFKEAKKIGELKGVDLDKIFQHATGGINLSQFLTLSFALLVNWFKGRNKKLDLYKEWVICKKKYFKKTNLDRAQVSKILEFLSIDIGNFSEEYDKTVVDILNGNDVPEYNFLIFQQRPFIHFKDDCYVCISPRYLVDRVTEGIYWIIENYLKSKDKKLWSLWPEIWGKAYEIYTNNIFTNIFDKSYLKNFKDKRGIERADGIFIGKNVLGMVQIKYAHWKYSTKVTVESKAMQEDLKKHLINGGPNPKGLGQHALHIKAYLKNEWNYSNSGIEPRLILPMLIVGETMPMDSFNRHFYEDLAQKAGLDFGQEIVLPFIVLDSEDVGILEAFAKRHGSLEAEKLLINYSEIFRDRDGAGYSKHSIGFKNFVLDKGLKLPKNQRLMKVFNRIARKTRQDAFGVKKQIITGGSAAPAPTG